MRRCLITENALRPELGVVEREVILIDGDWERIAGFSAENPQPSLDPESIALIIYTSGSTGRPKGATLPHRSLTNFAFWYNRHYALDASDAMILKSPFGFDAGSWEILTSLTNGGRVVVSKQEGVADSDYLIDLMVREGVTHGFFVPTHLRMLLDNPRFAECSQLKHLCVGGEAFPEDLREKFNAVLPSVRLDNFYGPSETTIGVLTWDSAYNDDKSVTTPIGRPIDNTQMYIVNDAMQPVPIGVQGELCIGGRAVGKGYWNRPKLTAEKFIDNPFGVGKLYKTGDFAAWRTDGAIEYFGRIDHQVKLRGLRIEMGEIEAGLVAHPAIDQAVVIVREDEAHDKKIIAYCVVRPGLSPSKGNDDTAPSADELRVHLGTFVPKYMVPAAFVWMDKLPVSPNGKIDRRQLPTPEMSVAGEIDSADSPRDALEYGLAQIWADVLKVPQVGIHDNFFDLGGHSLTALRLFSQVEEQYEHKLPLATLFEAPTIAQMADRLRDDGWQASWSSIVPIRASGHKTPFFHVGAYMESILAFTELNQYLDDERPFYGIQPQGLDDESKIQHDIDDMAEYYISEMKMIQPEGPYLIGGHCAGAIVAYEMAKKLEAQGDEVAMLAVVDSPAPNYVPPKEIPIWSFLKRMFYYLMDRRLLHAIIWQLRIQLESTILYRFGSDQAKRISAMRRAHNEAYARYQIEAGYHGPMTVYRSEEYLNLYDETIHTKWAELTDGSVHYEDVTGTHATLLKDPNVEILGEALQRNIERVEDGDKEEVSAEATADQDQPTHELAF